MAHRDYFELSLVAFVLVATIGVSASYFYYSGLLTTRIKARHPNVWADHFQKPIILGDEGSGAFWYFVVLGRYKGLFDEELRKLLWISRLLALGCAVGIPASIIAMAVAIPDLFTLYFSPVE
jgi:hypothetical protein